MEKSQGLKVKIQQFGSFLSGMIMPNIGAFIAWGIITAFFIPTGRFPNEALSSMVDPTIKYLLPILIGYTGGTLVYDKRGGVVAAMVTMGGHRWNGHPDVSWRNDCCTTSRLVNEEI